MTRSFLRSSTARSHAVFSQHPGGTSRFTAHLPANCWSCGTAQRTSGCSRAAAPAVFGCGPGRRESLRRAMRSLSWRKARRGSAGSGSRWNRRTYERCAAHRGDPERQRDMPPAEAKGAELEALLRFMEVGTTVKGRKQTPTNLLTHTSSAVIANFPIRTATRRLRRPGEHQRHRSRDRKVSLEGSARRISRPCEAGMTNTGSQNYGGPVVTAGGLLFLGATVYDHKLRAFDTGTGKVLWETELPSLGSGDAFHLLVDGRQYVVIAREQRADSERPARRHVRCFRTALNAVRSLIFKLTSRNRRC